MQITPNEISSIEDAGMLDGNPVKLLRTKGGFFMAIARPKGKLKEEAIAAGSHPAIVRFNIEKQYPDFQPAMMKSQSFSDSNIVDRHSHFLSDTLRKSGHDLYSIQNGSKVDFYLTKHNMNISSIKGNIVQDELILETLKISKDLSLPIASAVAEKALSISKKPRIK